MVVDDLVSRDSFVGTSLILHQDGRFLYGIRPPKLINGLEILEITGIGGRLEKFDENLTAGVLREACEEIAVGVKIIPCQRTLVVRGLDNVKQVELSGSEQPAALVFRDHRTPPHHPWHPVHQDSGCIAVFLGQLSGQPTPSEEIPYLIWMLPEQIQRTAKDDILIGELIDGGALLVSSTGKLPAPQTPARLTDSQEALALALGDKAAGFYIDLLNQISPIT
jgi:hypothetical protein